MTLKILKLDPEALTPSRAHDTDAGLDFYAPRDVTVSVNNTVTIGTGISIGLPAGTAGFMHSRSSQGLRRVSLANSTGIIDQGYTGEIMVTIENRGHSPYMILAGQKICQLIIQPVITPAIEIVDHLDPTARGAAGHGSTGK